jgi:hypothetical protein
MDGPTPRPPRKPMPLATKHGEEDEWTPLGLSLLWPSLIQPPVGEPRPSTLGEPAPPTTPPSSARLQLSTH